MTTNKYPAAVGQYCEEVEKFLSLKPPTERTKLLLPKSVELDAKLVCLLLVAKHVVKKARVHKNWIIVEQHVAVQNCA